MILPPWLLARASGERPVPPRKRRPPQSNRDVPAPYGVVVVNAPDPVFDTESWRSLFRVSHSSRVHAPDFRAHGHTPGRVPYGVPHPGALP